MSEKFFRRVFTKSMAVLIVDHGAILASVQNVIPRLAFLMSAFVQTCLFAVCAESPPRNPRRSFFSRLSPQSYSPKETSYADP